MRLFVCVCGPDKRAHHLAIFLVSTTHFDDLRLRSAPMHEWIVFKVGELYMDVKPAHKDRDQLCSPKEENEGSQ